MSRVVGIRRVREADDLRRIRAAVEPHEPRSTFVVAGLDAAIAGRRGVTIGAVEDAGTITGAVAWLRRCADRWSCYPVLLDPVAAPQLARSIDRSAARELFGFATDVDVLTRHLTRGQHETRMPGFAVPAPVPALPDEYQPDPGPGMAVRSAGLADVRALTGCYEGYELIDIPTVGQLRRHLRREMRHGHEVIVVERDGVVVAANRMAARSDRFAFWSDATVLPAERGHGVMRHLINGSVATTRDLGLGMIGALAPSNPMPVGHARDAAVDMGGGTDEWVSVWMGWRLRFRGDGRVRKARDHLMGRRRRRRRLYPSAGPEADR